MPSWIDYLLRYGAPDPDAAAAQADVPSGDLLAHIAGGLAKKGADTVQSAVTAPRDAYTGDLQVFDPTTGHVSDEAMRRANEMAGLAMTGGLGGAAVREGETVLGAGPIRAYHGSPHDFDRFDISKIGTGEGAQAYGHGLYFAGNEDVARIYRDALSPKLYSHPELGAGLTEADVSRHLSGAGQSLGMKPGSLLDETVQNAVNRLPKDRRGQLDYLIGDESHPQARQVLEQARNFAPDRAGRMYEVGIDADPAKMLDWDKSVGEQPAIRDALMSFPAVQKQAQAAKMLLGDEGKVPGRSVYARLADWNPSAALSGGEGAARAAQSLRDVGIPGLRYLDGGSRGVGEGSHNFVTFSDDIVKILRKYGLAGLAALGAGQGAVSNLGMGAPSQGMSN